MTYNEKLLTTWEHGPGELQQQIFSLLLVFIISMCHIIKQLVVPEEGCDLFILFCCPQSTNCLFFCFLSISSSRTFCQLVPLLTLFLTLFFTLFLTLFLCISTRGAQLFPGDVCGLVAQSFFGFPLAIVLFNSIVLQNAKVVSTSMSAWLL